MAQSPRVHDLLREVTAGPTSKSGGVTAASWQDRIALLSDEELIDLIIGLEGNLKIAFNSDAAKRATEAVLRMRWAKESEAVMAKTLTAARAALWIAVFSLFVTLVPKLVTLVPKLVTLVPKLVAACAS